MAQAEKKEPSTSVLQKMRDDANAHLGWHLMFPDLGVVSRDAHSELAKYADTLGSLSRECRLIIARLLPTVTTIELMQRRLEVYSTIEGILEEVGFAPVHIQRVKDQLAPRDVFESSIPEMKAEHPYLPPYRFTQLERMRTQFPSLREFETYHLNECRTLIETKWQAALKEIEGKLANLFKRATEELSVVMQEMGGLAARLQEEKVDLRLSYALSYGISLIAVIGGAMLCALGPFMAVGIPMIAAGATLGAATTAVGVAGELKLDKLSKKVVEMTEQMGKLRTLAKRPSDEVDTQLELLRTHMTTICSYLTESNGYVPYRLGEGATAVGQFLLYFKEEIGRLEAIQKECDAVARAATSG